MTVDDVRARVQERQARCLRLKEMVVQRLDLSVDPDWITDDQPLFGRGLELDSVDAIELVVGVEFEFGVGLTDDQLGAFGSVNALADLVEEVGEDLVSAEVDQ